MILLIYKKTNLGEFILQDENFYSEMWWFREKRNCNFNFNLHNYKYKRQRNRRSVYRVYPRYVYSKSKR